MKDAKPSAVTTAPGYDNQPMFSPDGGRILFAANRDGKQIDIFVFEREDGRVSQLTETPENENSPTYLPAGLGAPGAFSVVRTEPDKTQRLWRFDARGRDPQLVLTDIKPVGYHAWLDVEIVALFVLGPPATLQNRERRDRQSGDRGGQHRPLAAPHPRHAPRQLRASRRVGGVLGRTD